MCRFSQVFAFHKGRVKTLPYESYMSVTEHNQAAPAGACRAQPGEARLLARSYACVAHLRS